MICAEVLTIFLTVNRNIELNRERFIVNTVMGAPDRNRAHDQ